MDIDLDFNWIKQLSEIISMHKNFLNFVNEILFNKNINSTLILSFKIVHLKLLVLIWN